MSRTARPQPFTIYTDYLTTYNSPHDDYEPRMSTSPSPYDADNSLSSDDNESILPSIEAHHHSGRKSSAAFTNVSSIPPSLPYNSDVSPYTPQKGPRPAFRSPSSVRAMQMSSPPPFQNSFNARVGSPLSARRAARGGTPSSVRSGSVLHSARSMHHIEERASSVRSYESGRNTPSTQQQQQQQASPTRGPLVLLHVTVLPSPGLPYSTESLSELAPSYVMQNWRLLQEKLTETVFSRGVLIPHPGEEFDLLEEGLLETLDLCTPRIGACGHFYADEDRDVDSDSGNDSGVSDVGSRAGQKAICTTSHRWSSHSDMEDTCYDCAMPIRVPGKGIGSGNTRWDIKIYAANGLMRAGAWSAAWREMERVDVEIEPWIPDDVRRELDLRLESEQEKAQAETEELEKLRFDMEVSERLRQETEEELRIAEQRARDLEKDLEATREVQLTMLTAAPEPLPVQEAAGIPTILQTPAVAADLHIPKKRQAETLNVTPTVSVAAGEIPLSTLLRNYLFLLVQDKRNVAVALLSIIVMLLSLRLVSPPQATPLAPFTSDFDIPTSNQRMQQEQSSQHSQYATVSAITSLDTTWQARPSILEPIESSGPSSSTPIPTPSSSIVASKQDALPSPSAPSSKPQPHNSASATASPSHPSHSAEPRQSSTHARPSKLNESPLDN